MDDLPELWAYLGEDELDAANGVGLKQAMVPAGLIPMVATTRAKMDRPDIRGQLQEQARTYGKTIRLVRYEPVEVVVTLAP